MSFVTSPRTTSSEHLLPNLFSFWLPSFRTYLYSLSVHWDLYLFSGCTFYITSPSLPYWTGDWLVVGSTSTWLSTTSISLYTRVDRFGPTVLFVYFVRLCAPDSFLVTEVSCQEFLVKVRWLTAFDQRFVTLHSPTSPPPPSLTHRFETSSTPLLFHSDPSPVPVTI